MVKARGGSVITLVVRLVVDPQVVASGWPAPGVVKSVNLIRIKRRGAISAPGFEPIGFSPVCRVGISLVTRKRRHVATKKQRRNMWCPLNQNSHVRAVRGYIFNISSGKS